MKMKKLYCVILSCAVLFLLSIVGCKQQQQISDADNTKHNLRHSAGYIDYKNLKETWPKLKKENIRSIAILEGPEIIVDNSIIGVSKECLEGYIELLDEAINELKMRDINDTEQTHIIKIVTDKGVYFIPGDWMFNSKKTDPEVYGELWKYLDGCEVWKSKYDTSGWIELHSPRKTWPSLKKENIRKITFCYADKHLKADDWVVYFEVPQNCLKGAIELLDKAIHEQKKVYRIPDAWMGFCGMKIITDKGKYLVPAEWDSSKYRRDDTIYGSDWASSNLREYLRKCGWSDPNN